MQATGVLHQSLLDRIYQIEWASRITRDKAIAFVQSLSRKRHIENTDVLEYTDMAYVYFLQKLGSKYRQIIKPLLDHKILQSTGYYRPGWYNEEMQYVKGQCLSYRINPELLDDQVVKVIYKGDKKHQKCRDEVTMKSKQIMRQLRIPDMNSRELIKFVKRSLSDERILRQLRVNDQIQDTQVHIKGQPYPIPLDKVQRRSKDLIKDGKYCHIEHLHIYLKRKRRHLTQAYCDQLLRIKHRNVYADRNETNLRLDSNLTNLKSDYMSLLTIDGHRLSQIDLKNSQFRFFVMLLEQCERQILFGSSKNKNLFTEFLSSQTAKSEFKVRLEGGKDIAGKPITLLSILFDEYCINKEGLKSSLTADYKRFRRLVKSGQLYEYIQKIYWSETGVKISRKEAKKLMFTVAFSSYRYNPEGKRILKKYLPSIVAVIDGFKKSRVKELSGQLTPALSCEERELGMTPQEARDKGNASFAVMLQQVESVVFVDKILAECHLRGLKVLSKHDSIVCRQCDKRFVTSIICRTMNQIFGMATYSLDIDGEVFTLKAKRKSRLHRVATEVVHTLFGVTHQANAPPTDPKDRSNELRVSSIKFRSSEYHLPASKAQVESAAPTLSPISSPPNPLKGDTIKSERVRRLRDKLGL